MHHHYEVVLKFTDQIHISCLSILHIVQALFTQEYYMLPHTYTGVILIVRNEGFGGVGYRVGCWVGRKQGLMGCTSALDSVDVCMSYSTVFSLIIYNSI